MRFSVLLVLTVLACAPVPNLDPNELSCRTLTASDGDSIHCDGELMRLIGSGTPYVSGFDTGELRTYKCANEKTLAQQAHRRLKQLLPGAVIIDSGARDTTHRQRRLVRLRVADGRYAGDILLVEGLARAWPNGPKFWCE